MALKMGSHEREPEEPARCGSVVRLCFYVPTKVGHGRLTLTQVSPPEMRSDDGNKRVYVGC